MTILYGLLVLEGASSALWIARLLPAMGVRGWTVIVLVAARGLVSSLQFVSAMLLRTRRANGPPLARAALAGSSALITLEVGFRMVPTSVDPTFAWWIVGGYWAYAALAIWLLRERG